MVNKGMELSYTHLKTANEARESEEQKTELRKRSLILLIHNYLSEQGFINTGYFFSLYSVDIFLYPDSWTQINNMDWLTLELH